MKYVKMLGLLAVAAAALMAFAGPASATTVTSNAATEPTTPTITATSTNSKLDGSFVTVECEHSLVHGKVTKHGVGVTVEGHISTLHFTKCNYQVTVNSAGTLEAHAGLSTGNGTLTSTGANITIHTSVGSCTFTTNGTDIGELTGSNNTGGNAVLDINSAKIPRTAGNFLCGSSGTWTGNYTVTSPSQLEIH